MGAVSARSLMDRASDYGSEGWKFESSRARRMKPSGGTNGAFLIVCTPEVESALRPTPARAHHKEGQYHLKKLGRQSMSKVTFIQ